MPKRLLRGEARRAATPDPCASVRSSHNTTTALRGGAAVYEHVRWPRSARTGYSYTRECSSSGRDHRPARTARQRGGSAPALSDPAGTAAAGPPHGRRSDYVWRVPGSEQHSTQDEICRLPNGQYTLFFSFLLKSRPCRRSLGLDSRGVRGR